MQIQLPQPMSLSFCIIAKNESEVIAGALESIKHVADEVIVGIDDLTTDDTEYIVRKFGIEPFYFHWINNFAWVRNLTIDRAKCDHIFVIDPDERLTQQGHQLINILKNQSDIWNDSFAFNIKNIKRNGELIKVTLGPVRLFPNRPEIRYQFPMHETLMNLGTIRYMTFEALDHVGFDSTLQKVPDRIDRNERMLIERILQNFEDADSWRYLAYWYRFIGSYDQAAICAKEALRLPGEFNPVDYEQLGVIVTGV